MDLYTHLQQSKKKEAVSGLEDLLEGRG
jgi:hypothetical protein